MNCAWSEYFPSFAAIEIFRRRIFPSLWRSGFRMARGKRFRLIFRRQMRLPYSAVMFAHVHEIIFAIDFYRRKRTGESGLPDDAGKPDLCCSAEWGAVSLYRNSGICHILDTKYEKRINSIRFFYGSSTESRLTRAGKKSIMIRGENGDRGVCRRREP